LSTWVVTGGYQPQHKIKENNVPKSLILLDDQPTIDVVDNPELLHNIQEAEAHLDIHCTAGITITRMIGELKGYGTVWYHPEGIVKSP
jgi:hypothetical protein